MRNRKTRLMLELEAHAGKPIAEVVRQAAQDHDTANAAADALGVSRITFLLWCARFGIKTRRVVTVVVDPEPAAAVAS